MNNKDETNYNVTVDGRDYWVEIDDGRHGSRHGHFRVVDTALNVEIADVYGVCNPLLSFWNSTDNLLTGDARTSKINSIIKDAVITSLDDLAEFRDQIVECGDSPSEEILNVLAASGR
jgi:hypothetical protein